MRSSFRPFPRHGGARCRPGSLRSRFSSHVSQRLFSSGAPRRLVSVRCSGGPVDTGPGSLEAVRQQLAGTWELVSFEAFNGPGQSVDVPASGRLTYDEFGNLTLEGELEQDPAAAGGATLLNMSGRVAIDVALERFLILDSAGNVPFDEADFATASPDRFRYYEFVGDQLRLTVRNDGGETTSVLTWQRQ